MAKTSTPTSTESVEIDSTEVEAVEVEVTEAEPTEVVEEVEVPIDLTAFNAAVDIAVSEADVTTGDLPEKQIALVRDQYQALEGIKAKNAAKAHLAELLKKFLTGLNAQASRSVMILTEQAAVAGKTAAPKKEIDPTEAFVSGIAALTLGLYLAQRSVPEGVDGDAAVASATTKANENFAEALTVQASENQETENPLIRAALKVASVKARKAGAPRVASGERRDLEKHIGEAFAGVDEGTFLTVAEIRKFESTEYGMDKPSAGAITNRLEPKSGKPTTVPGIVVGRNADNKLGATKVAV